MDLLVDETQRLHTQLGKWVALPHHNWIWYYCMPTGGLYKKTTTYGHCTHDVDQLLALIQYIFSILRILPSQKNFH